MIRDSACPGAATLGNGGPLAAGASLGPLAARVLAAEFTFHSLPPLQQRIAEQWLTAVETLGGQRHAYRQGRPGEPVENHAHRADSLRVLLPAVRHPLTLHLVHPAH